jgi:hypothetical protein
MNFVRNLLLNENNMDIVYVFEGTVAKIGPKYLIYCFAILLKSTKRS